MNTAADAARGVATCYHYGSLEAPRRDHIWSGCGILLAGEDHPFLNVPRVGGDAYVRYSEERVRRYLVDLNAIAVLQSGAGDDALQCRVDRER